VTWIDVGSSLPPDVGPVSATRHGWAESRHLGADAMKVPEWSDVIVSGARTTAC
jgi:hypothetical protein